MSSAARSRIEDEPDPAPEDPRAKAGRVLDAHLALIERADAILGSWRDACPQDSQAVPALRELITETIGAGLHAEEMRQALAAQTATAGSLEAAFAAGRALERAEREAAPPAPGRHAAASGKRLTLLKGGSVAAFAGAAFTGLRHAWTVHPVYTAAAGVTAATALAATTAVVAPGAAATFGVGGPATPTPAPAASIVGAAPFPVAAPPSQKLIASVTGHRGGAGSRTLTVNLPPSLPLPSYAPQYAPQDPSAPSGGGNGQGQAPVTVAGTLTVSTSALDLSGSGLGSLTLSCSGGPCDWHLVPGRDVGADTRQGTLQDGGSVTVGLTVDPAALLLGGSATVRIWPGDLTVAVSWLAPVVPSVVPSVDPSAVASVVSGVLGS